MISPGEFWVADIHFTDQTASKKRPVLVLWLDAADVVVAAVTTAGPRTASDVRLRVHLIVCPRAVVVFPESFVQLSRDKNNSSQLYQNNTF